MNLGEFSMFSIMHAIVVVVVTVATVAVIRHALARPAERGAIRRRIGLGIVGVQVAYHAYWLGFRGEIETSLPLHLCDIAGLTAAAAMLTRIRALHTLLYFWGFSLSSLAFVIPVLDRGPATMEFWMFWLSHWAIVGGAIYLVAVDGYRPAARDLAFAVAVTIGYGLLMVPVNMALGSNYMYVGEDSPPTAFLGAWPLPRLPLLALSVAVLLSAAWLPWLAGRRPAPELSA